MPSFLFFSLLCWCVWAHWRYRGCCDLNSGKLRRVAVWLHFPPFISPRTISATPPPPL
ncbi:hypothetical protein DL89DRAFT_134251 [Linderina pennispora]|uniref:Secreted protein n=1 Tax=Linderina pennispora TaxID=61395 RepID=A0A1Y1VUU3_9FUNG|nr:uncharacterized protein DL89DRAFT_134251 [Linderina pennispora]ORX65050.1 hypothetical protein DL89DRAFT_134251 [Linderina pennispora]